MKDRFWDKICMFKHKGSVSLHELPLVEYWEAFKERQESHCPYRVTELGKQVKL